MYCNLPLVGSDFSQSAFGIAMPKNWIYAKDVDIVILSLREAGVLDNLRKKWFQANVCANSEMEDVSLRISVGSMGGLFFTFAVICVLSLVLYAWTKRFALKRYILSFIRKGNYSTNEQIETVEKPCVTIELTSIILKPKISIPEKL